MPSIRSPPPPHRVQAGIEKLVNLRVLFMSNNKIVSLNEIDKLASLDKLEDVLLVGNPIYNEYKDSNNLSEYRVEVRDGRGRVREGRGWAAGGKAGGGRGRGTWRERYKGGERGRRGGQ